MFRPSVPQRAANVKTANVKSWQFPSFAVRREKANVPVSQVTSHKDKINKLILFMLH